MPKFVKTLPSGRTIESGMLRLKRGETLAKGAVRLRAMGWDVPDDLSALHVRKNIITLAYGGDDVE